MKKKIKAVFILLFLMIVIGHISVLGANTIILLGDIDKNGQVDQEDIKIVLQEIAESKTNNEYEGTIEADVNADGKIDTADALILMRYKKAKENGETNSEWINRLEQEIIFNLTEEIKVSLETNNAEAQVRIQGKNYGEVTYQIEDESIATVNEEGKIKGLKEGTTRLKATESKANLEASCTITVTQEKLGIKLDRTEEKIDISENSKIQLHAELIGKESKITWTSSNKAIVVVDDAGLVAGKSNGEAIITARTEYGAEAHCKITVQTSPTSVAIQPEGNTTLTINKTVKLNAIITPNTANIDHAVTWETSNSNVAVVNNQGLVQAKGLGTCTITVTTANQKRSTYTINVTDNVVPQVTIKSSYTGYIITGGNTITYEITIADDNLESFDTSKVVLTGDLKEEAKLKVTGSGKQYTATVTVPEKVGKLGIVVKEGAAIDKANNKSSRVKYHDMDDYVFTLNETTANKSITVAVGVINSFYVKSYDFYLGDTKKIGGRTTNEYTYSGLTTGNSYKIRVKVNVYKDKETDNTVSGWLEKEIKVTENNGLEVHFINVAGSDCIFVKTKNGKTIMIDSGEHKSETNPVDRVPAIDKYLRKDKKARNGKNLVTANTKGIVKVDYLLLTHEHGDHVGGFEGLTGIKYKETAPGYKINEKNTINGDTVRYEFGNIILGCNVKKYKEDTVVDATNVVGRKNKAIYRYAKNTDKLISVTAGNVLKIDNMLLNIFYPYDEEDVPKSWITSSLDRDNVPTSGIRNRANVINRYGEKVYVSMTSKNNNSIVTKLICGVRKMLFTGDAEFYAEEILLGIPAKQIAKNNNELDGGLAIHSSNGGVNKDSKKQTTYLSLVYELTHNNYKNDALDNMCHGWSLAKLDNHFKLSRLTAKDLDAFVLKKAHHGNANTTSLAFLKAVKPNKIVASSGIIYNESTIKCIDSGPDFRIRKYYASEGNGTTNGTPKDITDNNWKNYIFGTNTQNKSIYIFTETGTGWDYTGAKI